MRTIESTLRKEMRQLKIIVEEARERLKIAPKGNLRIQKKRGHIEYYFKNDDCYGSNSSISRKNDRNDKIRSSNKKALNTRALDGLIRKLFCVE